VGTTGESSETVPLVLQFLPCETATFDLQQSAWILTRPLCDVQLPPGATFPFLLEELALYVQMTEGMGTHNLQIEVRVPQTQARIYRTPPHALTFPTNFNEVVDEVFYLKNVPIRVPGDYELRLLANSQELRSRSTATIRVRG
jgi:hypothetical protein